MADPQKRTYSTVYNALKQISDEEGIDFGLDGQTEEQFKNKYFTGPGNINNLYNKLSKISDEEGVDFGLGTRGEWLASFGYTEKDAQPRQTYQPTAGEMAGFQGTINRAGRAATNPTQGYDRKAGLMQGRLGLNVPQRVNIGESNNLTPTEERFNLETGKMEQGYMTGAGNEYDSKAIADMEQRQIDQAQRDERYRQTLPGQLDDAYAERDRLNAELAKYQGQWVDQDGRVHYANRGDEESVASLEAALRQNQQRITALEAERDDDGGTQFWRGFIDAAKNPSVQSFGLTDFNDMLQLMRIKNKVDNAQAEGKEAQLTEAEQQLMESTYLNNYAQSAFGDNRGFMYRAGGISMQALPFVAEFMATGGFSAISEKGAELGARAAEKWALKGLSKMFVKNLGVVAGDVAAGWAMANTTGLFRTAGDVMQRNIGDVAIDDNGNLGFEGGKSLGRSIYEAEVANTLEYYTEKLGEHLKLGNRLANVTGKAGQKLIRYSENPELARWIAKGVNKGGMGLSKLSKAVNYLSGNKWLEMGGIQDYPSEVVEEEANLFLNAILVGDNNLRNPGADNPESVYNPKTQLDIWGGMLFSIGLMQAPRMAVTGYNAAGYYAYKKNVDISDGNAAIVFGRDNWNMIKEQIDGCENDQLSALLETVVNGKMTDEQKTATMNYAANLIKMRGYNMGMMAGSKDEEESATPEAMASQTINQGYQAGRQAQMPDEMKMYVDEANAARENLVQYGNEFANMVTSQEPVTTLTYLMNSRNFFNDEQIAAAADYYQKMARAQGVMDGAIDNVDIQVEQANASVRGNTHQQTGSVIMAKGADDGDYYIIGGDIVTDPDTGMTSLAGTGGAVVVKDAVTGEVSVKSPQEVMMYSMQNADELIQQNETALRQQLMQQADDDITYGSPANEVYQLEDTVTLQDGEGNIIEGEIAMMPSSVDGVYVVYTPDGKALQFTADELNRRIVNHNGMEVQRATPQDTAAETQQPTEQQQVDGNIPEQGNNGDGDIPAQGNNANENIPEEEPKQSALSRIPVRTDANGQPVKNRKGQPILDWHKASVEDAAAALIETTEGDMVMARDTASDLVKNAKAGLERIRKQKPKGEDPIEIAQSRRDIKRQEQEQQAIIKQWQDVNQAIQKRMSDEAAARQAEIEARKRKEEQDKRDRERIREQIEKDKERRNKEYQPLVEARREMADDADALAILGNVEPRSLEEWVSSLLRPHSMLWQDASESEIGLQSELGLKRGDMQRMMSLLGNKENGAKPFGKVVLDIHEGLPEAMKQMYTDEDVRNTLLNLFGEGSSTRMMHLTEENRIAEALETQKENERRDREAEMEAWEDFYKLTAEERETFEDYMQQPPTEPEQEIINQIIADNEQNRRSAAVGGQPAAQGNAGQAEGGQIQVQETATPAGDGNTEAAGTAQRAEAATSEPPAAGDNVAGRAPVFVEPKIDKERSRKLLKGLADAYGSGDAIAIQQSASDLQAYVDEGGDFEEINDDLYDYDGNDPEMLAQQYATRVLLDRYLDDDEEQEYIRTGMKPGQAAQESNKKFNFDEETGLCTNPNPLKIGGNKLAVTIMTANNGNGWIGSMQVTKSLDFSAPELYKEDTPVIRTEEECRGYYASLAIDELKKTLDGREETMLIKGLRQIVSDSERAIQPSSTPIKSWTTKNGRKVELFVMPETVDEDGNRHVKIGRSVDGGEISTGHNNGIVVTTDNIDYEATYGDAEEAMENDDANDTKYVVTEVIYLPDGRIRARGTIAGEKSSFWLKSDPLIAPSEQLKPRDLRDDVKPNSAKIGESKAERAAKYGFDRTPPTKEESVGIIQSLIDWAKKKVGQNKRSVISGVTDRQLKKLEERGIKGVDAEYVHSMESSNLIHEDNRHSADNRGQIPLTEEELSHIVDVLEDFDDIVPGGIAKATGLQTIRYEKKSPDGTTTYYVEEIRTGRKSLAFKTAYKKINGIDSSDGLMPKTSPSTSTTLSDNLNSEGKDTNNSANLQENQQESSQEAQNSFKRPGIDTPEGEILVKGDTILKNNMAGGEAVALIVGSSIDKKTGKRRYTVIYYSDEQAAKERGIAIGDAEIGQDEMREHLANGDFSTERIRNDWEKEAAETQQPTKQKKPTDLRDAVRTESAELGVNEANARARQASGASFLDAVRDLYSRGKEYAAKLYQRSFFDVTKTPDFMKELGLTGDKFTIRYGVISRHFRKDDEHSLPESVWEQLPDALKSPFAITRYYSDTEKKVQKGYRLYTTLKLSNGSFVVVSAEVKNAGKDIEVNAINTVFGRDALSEVHDELIYTAENITPEQQALLDGNNPRQYPAERELSEGKDTNNSANLQEKTEKSSSFGIGDQFVDRNDSALTLTITGVEDGTVTYEPESLGTKLSPRTTSIRLFEKMVSDFFSPIQTESNDTKKTIGTTSSPEQIAQEEGKVNTNPSEAQKEAGNYQKGHINIDGYDITIENPKGSVRRGTDASGKPWKTEMHNTYGYIRGTEGVDGDHIDVFLSDNPTSGSVYVVDQINPDTNEFDEHKVMYGFSSEEEARQAYLSNYSKGWKGLGNITEVSRENFKKWIESSHRKTKPFAEYKSVKKGAAETQQPTQQAKSEREHKRIVSDDQMEKLRKKLLAKFNNLNSGIDVERMLLGTMYAVGKIERGVTKFADYAREMVDEIGDSIRPYLKAFYNAVRDMPEAAEYRDQMDTPEYVNAFDVDNFDKQAKVPDAITKAQQVVRNEKAKKQIKKVKKQLQDGYAGSFFEDEDVAVVQQQTEQTPVKARTESESMQPQAFRPVTQEELEENPTVYHKGKPYHIMMLVREGSQTDSGQFEKPRIVRVVLHNGESANVDDLTVADNAAHPAQQAKEEKKRNNPWWTDENRPKSIDPNDYKTYMTPEAKEYFANYVSQPDDKGRITDFTKWAHPNLAFITAAVWDEVEIPYEDLKNIPEIVEAENTIKSAESKGKLEISDEEANSLAQRLIDSGEARQERKALVIIGLPAGGKSSVFANPLAKEYGARIIDSDDVKPWLKGFDGGNGAGYVQDASADVAERAIDIAVKNGDNIIIPRIGGKSVMDLSAALRLAGYDVQLYFNDVKGVTSIDRAASRFAQTGRYLSLDYLTKKAGVPSENFSNFAEKTLGGYLDERNQTEVQNIRGRVQRLRGELYGSGSGLWESLASKRDGTGTTEGTVQTALGSRELQAGRDDVSVLLSSPLFNYAEWKSNDVPLGQKPKEIWNSESGQPMPGKKEEKNNEGKQEVSRKPESAGEGTGQASGSAERTGAERSPEPNRAERSGSGHSVKTPLHNNRRNNVGERGKDYAPTSPKARFNANVEAIKMMRALIDDGVEAPTKDQMAVLRQYSGWGGMGTFFNDESSAENQTLRDLLTDEEYNDAAMSINSAYYTPAMVIDTLWDIAKAMGFEGGNTLEGSAGIGNIIGQMPKDMSRRSNIEAVEIDSISGNILKLLYPDAKVHIQGFQDTVIPNGTVDLAVTNVPFVTGLHVIDKMDKDLSRRFTNIHDFCIAKNIRKLREGGIGLFITSSGTLDKSNDLRAWITDEGQADVVGAFRLNNKTFGGTTVTSDIIVVRKRVGNQKSPNAIDISKASPIRVGTYEDKYGNEHQVSMVVNDYFKEHPEMMAGEMAFGYEKGDTFRPGSYGLYTTEDKDQEKMLKRFAKEMGKAKEEVAVPQQQTEQVQNQLTAEKEGRMLIDEKGRLCVSQRGVAVPLGLNDQKVKGHTKAECFRDYQEVQKAVDDVLQQQLGDPDDAALKPKLDALNKAYDKFVKRYGYLHKNTAIAFLRKDIDFPSFLELEKYSESKDIKGKVTVTTRKAPLFTQRVLGFKTEPKPKTVKDAVISSIFRTNGIDLEWITAKLNEVAASPNGENWTTEDVRKGILVSRLGFENPSTGQLEIRYKYLSGNVREKLSIAEAYNTDGKYAANVEELRKVVPMDIPAHLIDFTLGSSWIPNQLYIDYLRSEFGLPKNIKLTHLQGTWVLDIGSKWEAERSETNKAKGVYSKLFRSNILGSDLVVAALNNRPYKVARQSKEEGTIVDREATSACNVRIDEIKDGFKDYIRKRVQEDPELARNMEKIYNDKFNALVPLHIDDEMLPERFEDANMNISLYDHQKRGVLRGVTSPTMLAHEVGTGKSFTLISTAMEMRRLGTAKKPMIVVQNATVAQMTADAKLLYPNAKVLSLSEKDRDAEGRRAFYAKIRFNDWDMIIIPQSTLDMIPDSPQRELQFIQEQIDEKKHIIELARAAKMDSREIRRLEKELAKKEEEYGDTYLDNDPAHLAMMDQLAAPKKGKKKDAKREAASLDKSETKAREKLDRAVDDVQYFDDLGVDAILVDEAHGYKHLGFETTLGRSVKGVDPSYSKKCAGLYNKTRSVFEKAGWKNVVFATGTPISNTAAEIWTFMKYLMPADVMRQNDIYYFDDFVHNFGSINQMLEFKTNGKFNEVTRFAAYVNRPELVRIWMQVADIVRTEEVGEVKSKVPEKEKGKDQDVFLPQSPSLVDIMSAVRAELERYENMDGKQKKENSHIPLTMYGIAKRAAIDPRLIDSTAPDEPLSKTNAAVKEIVKDLKATQSYKGTVAVFCDNQNRKGADGSIDFNIFDDMKAKLVKQGVPEAQIAIIKSSMSITAKQKIFDKVNTGDVRVILGSTQTLGTGVNIQERLHLLIHMDAPDRPMDYTQRNGRIERQGNLHREWGKSIRILRFGVEDSLDVTAYQRLKTKSGFIDSIMNGKGALANNQTDRTIEEEEEGLFDNPVAVLSGSQFALKKNQAERQLRKMRGKYSAWEADQIYISSQLRHNEWWIKDREQDITENEQALARMREMFPDGKPKVISLSGVNVNMSGKDADKQLTALFKEKINDPVNALMKQYRGLEFPPDKDLHFTVGLDGHDVDFRVEIRSNFDYKDGKRHTIVYKRVFCSSTDLNVKTQSAFGSTDSVQKNLEEIIDQYVSGTEYIDNIDADKASIERTSKESAQLKEREGQPFQFGKELEEARKQVEEYTELMKKEMQEKEAKYAAQSKETADKGGFNLKKAEENSDDDEDGNLYSADEDWEDTDPHVARVMAALNEKYPGFSEAYELDDFDGQYNVYLGNAQTAVDIYNQQYPEANVTLDKYGDIAGDWHYPVYIWGVREFENMLKDPSLQEQNDRPLSPVQSDAEAKREDIIHDSNFKNYFGDWENTPENASKVVDGEGKPLILYHGTNLTQVNGGKPFWEFYPGSHFGTIGQSSSITARDTESGDLLKTYPVYLNIRNPKRVSDTPADWEETHSEWWEQQVAKAMKEGYDGIVYLNRYEDPKHPADSWIAFYPEQIKSATENVGTYDPANADIRQRMMEQFREGETFPIHSTEMQSSYNVLDRSRTYSTELIPDEYPTEQAMLDALRMQYPEYFVSIEDGNVRMESWGHVMRTADIPQSTRQSKDAKSYVERKTRKAIAAVEDLARRMGLDVEVLTTTEGLKGKDARAKGIFNPKTGKIRLILPNNASQSDLIKTLLHEGVAHFGLRKMFGPHFNTFLDNVYNNVSPEIKARIDAAMKRNKWGRHEATEEYLARLAERTDFDNAQKQGWWNKIKNFFVRMLTEAGLVMQEPLTDNELRYILWRSYDNLLHPDSRRSIFDTAKEITMRQRFGISRYARERERLQRTGRIDTSRTVAAEAGGRVNEEMLNRDIESIPSQDLLLSLSQETNQDERDRTIDELSRRIGAGEARINRLGEEMERGRRTHVHRMGVVLAGQQLVLHERQDGELGAALYEGTLATESQRAAKELQVVHNDVVSWAKRNGYYISEDEVKKDSLGGKVFASGAESRVYRTKDGKKVIKFMIAESSYYDVAPLLKRLDDLAIQNAVLSDPIDVIGFTENEKGQLNVVVEQDFIEGDTLLERYGGDTELQEEYDDAYDAANAAIDAYLTEVLGLERWEYEGFDDVFTKKGILYKDIHGGNVIVDKNGNYHIIDGQIEYEADRYPHERMPGFSIEDEEKELYSIRTKEPPKKTGIGYKVFVLKDGQLYPPMVANPNGEGTPVGVWLDADAAPIAGTSKTGRPQVKAGGKGTQGGSGQLAYRPGWHLGTIPYALQFNRKDQSGERTLFPNNFVWAEVEYADDVDYQDEARKEGMNANGKYQHSLAGLKHVPTDGSYKYRTNPDPRTDEWVITGAMRVNKILSREEVDELVKKAGREPQPMQDGDILTQEAIDELNAEIKATKEADEMGLLYSADEDWADDVAQETYEKAVAQEGIKLKEAWQDSMVSLKLIQNAIARETGRVATGAEDAYRYENRMHGRAKNMTEKYDWQYYRPMLKAFNDFCKERNMTWEQGMDYLISKSGLERNVYYAFRDGAKAKLADDIKQERDRLEKDYAKKRISEADYLTRKQELAEKERTGVDDFMKKVREMYAYQHAKEEYQQGNIGYTEYLRIIETVIRGQLKRKNPKRDGEGNIVSTNYYDETQQDFSGLTETFAKELYDEAQQVKKQAQRAIDPQERKAAWREYDQLMKEAYVEARQVAEDAVFAAEEGGAADAQQHTEQVENTRELWEKINAATKETLRHSYESGLIDRDNYNKVREMFDYYIPLRGWEEDKASDVYTYMGKDNVFSPAVKKTWGRKSKAENPLAYIGNIAVSTILSGHRNQMKQHFLNYVMNNPTSLVSISESWYENIAPEGESPMWILRTADTAGKSGDEIAQIVNDFNDEMHQKQKEGKAMPVKGRLRLDVNATKGQKAEHVVEVQRAGHTYQLYINGNPKAAQALNGTAAKAVSRISDTWMGKKITSVNRNMAEYFTSKNPAFVVSNLSRDLNMAGASVAINEGAAYNGQFIANVARVLRPRMGESSKWIPASKQPTGMMPDLMRKWKNGTLDTGNEVERYFQEFMDEGGETGFVNMLSVDSFKEKMQKEVREMNGSSLFGAKAKVKETSVHKGLRLLGETFEFYNRCAEDATRFIVYMTSRQMGKSLEESIADAKDVTLNFNRKGTGGMGNAEVRDLFIFVNPAIQALANMYRMAKNKPLKFGAVTAAFIAGGALMPVINQWLLNMWGDDDDKEAYWNLPPWVRKNNLVFWIPFTKNFMTIPLAQEFRVFYGMGEMITSGVMNHPVDKMGLEIFSSVADLIPINPTGNGGNLMVDFAPTMVQPLMQVGENVDFTGKPIWKENQGNKHAPMYAKAYSTTPTWMVKVSEGINDLTGGNEGRKGAVERYAPFWGDYINNPAVWNHLLQGYFGGMYNTIAKTFDVGVTAVQGEVPKLYQTPVINRFLNRPVERDNAGVLGEDYYSLTENRDALQFELRTWQKKAADGDEGAQEHVDEILQSDEWKKAEVISHYEKIMKDLKAGERAATESADKADIKESISLYKQQMMEELNALDEGKDPVEAAVEAFNEAETFAEKNRLRMRIERLMMRESSGNTAAYGTKGRNAEVEKALSYISDEERESRSTNENYLKIATAENVRDDARIKAAKAKIKKVTDEYKRLTDSGAGDKAAEYRRRNQRYFTADAVVQSQSRAMQGNKKLLGKGHDAAIMKLIDQNRQRILKAVESLE